MIIIVGLGNPGSEYANHRHNVGWMVLDAIADRYGFSPFHPIKFKALASEGVITSDQGNVKALLVKPQTYMNLSGQTVQPLLNFFKWSTDCLCVIHDDIDLPFGDIRMKKGGGAGGHNGLKSLDQSIGKDYWRLRIGVGHPGHRDLVSDYVLSNFSAKERPVIEDLCHDLAHRIGTIITVDGIVPLK